MISALAAVLRPGHSELVLETLELEPPREGEVLVKIAACGICHTDSVLRDGTVLPRPVVLGHEGAGVVIEVGRGVSDFQTGDHVVASFGSCGSCRCCASGAPAYCRQFFHLNFSGGRSDGSTSLSRGGEKVHSHVFGQSSFATHALCPVNNLVRIDDSVPLELAGPFGCGFQTGAGAVLNAFQVPQGASLMVLGAGAVGLAAVMAAARIARAERVIAVDLKASRLEIARSVGATDIIDGGSADLEGQVKSACPDGVDFILDTTGHLPLAELCQGLLAPRGTLGLAASYPPGAGFSFDAGSLMSSGRRIRGVMEGDSDIRRFIPQLLEHHRQGRFPVEKIVQYFDFRDINRAIQAAEEGGVIKAIVKMP